MGEGGKEQRVWGYDFLRIVAAVMVIAYHYDYSVQIRIPTLHWSFPTYHFLGLSFNAGYLAVCLFFMLSGALTGSTLDDDSFDAKTFLRHRLGKLMPTFWLSWVVVCAFLTYRGETFHAIPAWRFVLTVLGIDGYLNPFFGGQTYYLVGEWFFGAFVLLMVTWPVIRLVCRKSLAVGIGLAFALELVPLVAPQYGFVEWPHIDITSFPACLTSFLLGMMAHRHRDNDRFCLLAGALLIIAPVVIRFSKTANALDEQSFALGLVVLAGSRSVNSILERLGLGAKALLVRISGLTLYTFMFQSVVIRVLCEGEANALAGDPVGNFEVIGLLVLVLATTLLVSLSIQALDARLRSLVRPIS